MLKGIEINGKGVKEKPSVIYDTCLKDEINLDKPAVVYNGKEFMMWYCCFNGNNWNIHHATSDNGKVWAEHGPAIKVKDINDDVLCDVFTPFVMFDGKMYRMWFVSFDGSHTRLFYTTSLDGKTWGNHSVLSVLNHDIDMDNIVISTPTVIEYKGNYRIWLTVSFGVDSKIYCFEQLKLD